MKAAIKTRINGLGYKSFGPSDWRFVDLETGEFIGAIYPAKDELLSDLEHFAQQRGYTHIPGAIYPAIETAYGKTVDHGFNIKIF